MTRDTDQVVAGANQTLLRVITIKELPSTAKSTTYLQYRIIVCDICTLRSGDLASLRTLICVSNLVLDHLSIVKASEACFVDSRLVHEDVLSILSDYEAPSFLYVKPFHLRNNFINRLKSWLCERYKRLQLCL